MDCVSFWGINFAIAISLYLPPVYLVFQSNEIPSTFLIKRNSDQTTNTSRTVLFNSDSAEHSGSVNSLLVYQKMLKIVLFWTFRFCHMLINVSKFPRVKKGLRNTDNENSMLHFVSLFFSIIDGLALLAFNLELCGQSLDLHDVQRKPSRIPLPHFLQVCWKLKI